MTLFNRRIFVAVMILALLLLASGGAPARALQTEPLPHMQTPPAGPVVARVYYPDRAALEKLGPMLDTWEVLPDQGYLVALLTPQEYVSLLSQGYRVEIDDNRTALVNQPRQPSPGQVNGIPGFACYRTVEETFASMASLASAHPRLASWQDIGDSWEKITPGGLPGYDLKVLVLTNQDIPGPKPKFFLMAEIHAREYTTAETAARFAEHLVNNYGVDPDVTWLLDTTEVHILPMTNPDGRKKAEAGNLWRKNTDNDDGCTFSSSWGTDLNRNSSFHWGGAGADTDACGETYSGPSAASEPEVQAVQDYVASIFPDQRGPAITDPAPLTAMGTFITLHSFSGLVLWPWGDVSTPAPNAVQLQTLGRKFAYFNHYTPEQSVSLYRTTGATDDWAYGELGLAAYTFELGTYFFQGCGYFVSTLYPDNLQALLYAAKSARQPYTLASGPDALSTTAAPLNVTRGEPLRLTATIDDTRFSGEEPTQNIAQAVYTVDAPPWAITSPVTYTMPAVDGAFDEKIEPVQADVDTTGLSTGRHTLLVRGKDASGKWGPLNAAFVYIYDPGGIKPITQMELTRATTGTIYAGSPALFSADLSPDDAVKPYTYTLDYGEGAQPVIAIASSDPLPLPHAFVSPGDYVVEMGVWNSVMTAPVTATLPVTVLPTLHPITQIDLSITPTVSLHAGDVISFTADILPSDAAMPYTYTIDYGDVTQPITATSSTDPLPLGHLYTAPGEYTALLTAWNIDITQPVSATVIVPVLPVEEQKPPVLYLPLLRQ